MIVCGISVIKFIVNETSLYQVNSRVKPYTESVKHIHTPNYIVFQKFVISDHLVGIMISMSDCHPRGPEFNSRLDQEF